MPRLPLLAVCASLAALAGACEGDRSVRISSSSTDEGGVLKAVTALQCPDEMGSLTRKGSAHSDGTVCVYTGPRGAEVTLSLVSLGEGGADTALKGFEQRLLSVMPNAARSIAQAQSEAARADAEAARADAEAARAEAWADAENARTMARADAENARTQARAEAENARADAVSITAPGARIEAKGERASVNLPGIHINADGEKADVRIGGLTIKADDQNATINATAGDGGGEVVSIQAHDDVAEIRTRAPGGATRQTYILTDDQPSPEGWRLVGYEARGPRGGPIVVATVRAKERNSDGVFDDAKDLVSLNVGE